MPFNLTFTSPILQIHINDAMPFNLTFTSPKLQIHIKQILSPPLNQKLNQTTENGIIALRHTSPMACFLTPQTITIN